MRPTSFELFKRFFLPAAIVASVAFAPVPGMAAVTAFKQAVAEASSQDDEVAAFYRARNFAPLWTGEGPAFLERRQALIDALRTAPLHGLPEANHDPEALISRMSSIQHSRDMGLVEVELSRAFLKFAHDLQSGVLEPGSVVSGIKRKAPRRNQTDLLTAISAADPAQVMKSLVPPSREYARLMKEKFRLERLVSNGGWGAAVPGRKLSPGDSGNGVVALRNRLVRMGYLSRTASANFDSAMEHAVQAFQSDHGLTEDGVAGEGTIAEINKTAVERLKSVIVAMERERWTNFEEGRGERHVLVNLTDFKARIIDDGKITFETRSVIGHRDLDRRTPEFSDVMEHMIINPSWHVPRSIIVKEYLPRLRANPGSVGHLQLVDRRGRVVGRDQDFEQYSSASFPFAMRQPPGPSNALGIVKFMFPNKYNIYLHDTPAKNLFSREVRAFSHGCIRLADPKGFAYALLARQSDDPKGVFHSKLRTGSETKVDLVQDVPVHLIYRTAYSTAKGRTQFRRDIYGRDSRVWSALAAQGVALPGVEG